MSSDLVSIMERVEKREAAEAENSGNPPTKTAEELADDVVLNEDNSDLELEDQDEGDDDSDSDESKGQADSQDDPDKGEGGEDAENELELELEGEDDSSDAGKADFNFDEFSEIVGTKVGSIDELKAEIKALKDSSLAGQVKADDFVNAELADVFKLANEVAKNGGNPRDVLNTESRLSFLEDQKKSIQSSLEGYHNRAKTDAEGLIKEYYQNRYKMSQDEAEEAVMELTTVQQRKEAAEALDYVQSNAQYQNNQIDSEYQALQASKAEFVESVRKQTEAYKGLTEKALKEYKDPHGFKIKDSHRKEVAKILEGELTTVTMPEKLYEALSHKDGKFDANRLIEAAYLLKLGDQKIKALKDMAMSEGEKKQFLKQTGASKDSRSPRQEAPAKGKQVMNKSEMNKIREQLGTSGI